MCFTDLGKLNLPKAVSILSLTQFFLLKMTLAIKVVKIDSKIITYNVFRRFRQVKFAYGGSIISLTQFFLLSQRSLKRRLLLRWSKLTRK
jgi:hypothetical protein